MGRWDEYDEPVLRALFELKEEALDAGEHPGSFIDGSAIAERSGLPPGRVIDSLLGLQEAGLIDAAGGGLTEVVMPRGLTAEGFRALREWPGSETLAEVLPALLEALAERTDDPERKTLLHRAAEVAQSVTAAMIAAAVQEVTGLR